ncbi:MAG TPA: extracellular solute-binding protein [Pseudonocardia sp.]|nr:extracellular solute-binding protein [Pseudonocardia sp.]
MINRLRRAFVLITVLAAALALAGCGSSEPNDGKIHLRMTWWGSDSRHKATQAAIEKFQALHPNIVVSGEFGDWNGYWDKLSTSVAARDAPDVIQMDEKYLRDYATRGALLDLKTQADVLDTSKFDPKVLSTGETDGGLYGLTTGVNAFSLVVNPKLFEAAGVPLPDDTTWTWADYARICREITESSADGVYGCSAYGGTEVELQVWAIQHGQALYTANGQVGVTPELVTEYYRQLLNFRDTKVNPPASFSTEEATAPLDQSGIGTNKTAMAFWWSNQIKALEGAAGTPLKLLRQPSPTGHATNNGMYYKSSMFWSASGLSEHPREAAMLIDFLANSPEAGASIGVDRGVPSNLDVRTAITPNLKPTELATTQFVEAIAPDITFAPPPPPVGAGAVEQIALRYTSEVLFDRKTPEEAAGELIDEIRIATSW